MKTSAGRGAYSTGNIDRPPARSHLAAMTYEYVCSACSFEWEAEQSISEPPLRICPSCKSGSAKRQVSGGQGFILRGGGWYADGYGSAKPASTETKPTTPKSEAPAAKSESTAPAAPKADKPSAGS